MTTNRQRDLSFLLVLATSVERSFLFRGNLERVRDTDFVGRVVSVHVHLNSGGVEGLQTAAASSNSQQYEYEASCPREHGH
jgi:hypothetical protein